MFSRNKRRFGCLFDSLESSESSMGESGGKACHLDTMGEDLTEAVILHWGENAWTFGIAIPNATIRTVTTRAEGKTVMMKIKL